MTLYAQDWVGDYCDNPRGLSQSTSRGYWNVIVDQAGEYKIELRRWSKESGKRLTDGWPERSDLGDCGSPHRRGWIAGGGYRKMVDTHPGDTHASFRFVCPLAGRN